MVAIGMALIWGGYYLGLWGYCLVNGYDVTFTSLAGTKWTSAPQSGPAQQLPLPANPGIGTALV
jgi:hypothetical protein